MNMVFVCVLKYFQFNKMLKKKKNEHIHCDYCCLFVSQAGPEDNGDSVYKNNTVSVLEV